MVTEIKLQPQIPTPIDSTGFAAFYEMVRLNSEALNFRNYSNFINAIFCVPAPGSYGAGRRWKDCFPSIDDVHLDCDDLCFSGLRAYDKVREATDLFIASQAALTERCCYGCGDGPDDRTLRTQVAALTAEMEKPGTPEQLRDVSQRLEQTKQAASGGKNTNSTHGDRFAWFGACSLEEISRRFGIENHNFTEAQLKELASKLFSRPGQPCQPTERDPLSKSSANGATSATPTSGSDDPRLNDVLTFLQQLRENQEGVPLKDCTLGSGNCTGILLSKLRCPPMLELIWSYWMEQGMLVQGINALTLRYQNRRPIGRDPLTRCDISPLRPLNNIFWGYIQRENDRLSVVRRAYEYDHHYGLRLGGQAIPRMAPADSRSQFIEAFHRLLGEAARYYRTSMDTTMNADGFPILNSLRELHLVLAEGAHNQFGDLPTTARAEMLIQQWILARPEIRDFLGGRPGVPYPERWMPHTETLRQMMGWNDTTIRHYRDLAVYGERLLLSIRYLPWSTINDGDIAKVWAQYWRQEVQAYLHSYRAVTGVDLSIDDVRIQQSGVHLIQPSDLIRRRRVAISQTMGA